MNRALGSSRFTPQPKLLSIRATGGRRLWAPTLSAGNQANLRHTPTTNRSALVPWFIYGDTISRAYFPVGRGRALESQPVFVSQPRMQHLPACSRVDRGRTELVGPPRTAHPRVYSDYSRHSQRSSGRSHPFSMGCSDQQRRGR